MGKMEINQGILFGIKNNKRIKMAPKRKRSVIQDAPSEELPVIEKREKKVCKKIVKIEHCKSWYATPA